LKVPLPTRFWVEVAMGFASAALLALTLVLPNWFEVLFGLAPDDGDGSAEWGLVVALAVLAILLFGSAGRTWRRRVRLVHRG
jgi:hypothetical protein